MGSAWAKLGLAVGGALLGGALFGAIGMSAGFFAGSYVGNMVFPTDYDTKMPPVHDYPVQNSAAGIPIPFVFGTKRLAGNIVWMGKLQAYHIKHKAGGKGGGGGQASYETRYRRSFLIAICEGKATIQRAWAGKEEISTLDFTVFKGDGTSGISALIGKKYAEYDNVCCAYFENYELGNSQRLPNFVFEIGYRERKFPLYIGTDESPGGDDLFEVDYNDNIIHQEQRGHSTNGIQEIKIQPSTERIIVSGTQIFIFEKDWTYVSGIPLTADTILIDPDDDNYMYVGSASGIRKYHIGTQVLQWQNTTYSAYGITISGTTGKLYISGVIGDGINEINRSTGAWVRNLVSSRGHNRIAWRNDYIYATGSRQGFRSVWKYDESTGALFDDYDTGAGTHKIVMYAGGIYVCGQRTNAYNPPAGITGYKTIFRFDSGLNLRDAYDDGNSVYWLNDMEVDTTKDLLVVTSKGNAVDENGATANVRWFDYKLNRQDYALIYHNSSTCVATAFSNNEYMTDETNPDYNFALMIKDLLTHERLGNYDESDLITEDFDSVIDYCETNNLKGSLVIKEQKPLPDWIAYICSHFQGYFYEIGGKVGLNCYRIQSSVLSITADDLVREDDEPPVRVTKRVYNDTFNRLEATWTDRDNNYKTAVVPAFDRIDQREAGQVRTKTLDLNAICRKELASSMAWRLFIDQIYRFSQYTFKLGYKSMLLEVGDVIDVTDGHLLVAQKMRVMSVSDSKDGRVAIITAVEDISEFYPSLSYEVQQSEADPPVSITLTDGTISFREDWIQNQLHLSITPGGEDTNGFYVYRSYDGASYELVGRAVIGGVTGGEANSKGTIQSDLPAYTSVIHRKDESFDVSIGTVTDLDTSITDENFFNNRKLAKIGDEIIAYKTCVESSVAGTWKISNIIRGLFGTNPVTHFSGEVFSTLDIDFTYNLQESDIGQTLYFKVVSYYANEIQLVSDVSAQTYQIKGLWKRPAAASLLRLASDENEGGSLVYSGSSFTLYWNLPGQKGTGFNQGGYDLNTSWPIWRYGDSVGYLTGGNGVLYGNYFADADLQAIDLVFEETDGTPIGSRSVAATAQSAVIDKATDLGGNSTAVIKVYPRRAYRTERAESITVTGV